VSESEGYSRVSGRNMTRFELHLKGSLCYDATLKIDDILKEWG
jgi:hypothetical protein